MTLQSTTVTALLAGTIALFSAAAQAQATIDQNKALAGNVSPGDGPGFPVTITVPGAYKLTGNLVVPAGLSGVVIAAAGVTLDLNGFNISGPITCTRNDVSFVVTCSALGGGSYGVESQAGSATVRNGGVRGFGSGMLHAGADLIENVVFESNALYGMLSPTTDGARTLIRGVRSQYNGVDGFSISSALVQNSSAAANGGNGLTGGRTVVQDSVVVNNRLAGFNGNNLVVGRTQAELNKGGDYVGTTSVGGNLKGNSSVPF